MRHCLGALLVIGLISGCGPRTEVAKEKITKKIDEMLGEMDVARKDIEMRMDELDKGIEGMRKARIKAEVNLEQIARNTKPKEQSIGRIDEALGKLRPHLDASSPVDIVGTTLTPDQIKDKANKLLKERETLTTQLKNLRIPVEALTENVVRLEQKQKIYQDKLESLSNQVKEIDAKRVALKVMQDTSDSMGDGAGSLSESVADLEDKVNDLFADVETALRVEDEKWDEGKENAEIDSIIAGLESSDDTAARIDAILGTAGESNGGGDDGGADKGADGGAEKGAGDGADTDEDAGETPPKGDGEGSAKE